LFFALLRPAQFLCTLPAVGGLPRFFRARQVCHNLGPKGKLNLGQHGATSELKTEKLRTTFRVTLASREGQRC
jgi:hypothetical protein